MSKRETTETALAGSIKQIATFFLTGDSIFLTYPTLCFYILPSLDTPVAPSLCLEYAHENIQVDKGWKASIEIKYAPISRVHTLF